MQSLTTWLLAATTAICTTHHLIFQVKQRYPFHYLLLHFATALILRLGKHTWLAVTRNQSPLPSWNDAKAYLRPWQWLYGASVITSLALAYRAMFDLPSGAALVMILALEWRPEAWLRGGLSLVHNRQLPELQSLLRGIILLCGLSAIYLKDYRLEMEGIKFSLLAFALTGIAKIAYFMAEQDWSRNKGSSDGIDGAEGIGEHDPIPGTLILLAGTVTGAIATVIDETGPRITFKPAIAPVYMTVSVIAGGIALERGGHLFQRMGNRHSHREHVVGFLDRTTPGRILTSTAVVHAVFGASILIGSTLNLDVWQYLGFLLASSATLTWTDLGFAVKKAQQEVANVRMEPLKATLAEQESLIEEPVASKDSNQPSDAPMLGTISTWFTATLFFAVLIIGPFLVIQQGVYNLSAVTPSFWDRSGTSARSSRALDLVIARYDESAEQVANDINALVMLPNLGPLNPNVIIYDKAENANTSTWANDLEDLLLPHIPLTVVVKPNIGREAEAYLGHIIDHWDDIADHTLFSQAAAHDIHALRRRLQDYFVPETGFLTLSYVGGFCSHCSGCKDLAGWGEQDGVLEDIYSMFNNGSYCQDLVLAYRGQFVVSRNRIRSNDIKAYQHLRNQLIDMNDDKHKMPYLDQNWMAGRRDRLDAPNFGFTIERMWGAIMQCSDQRIAKECPSLLAGLLGNRMPLGACQCLDMVDSDWPGLFSSM
ncbi:hypothetical protein D0866_06054 [Hortaea werneckii]|uniref:Uncharacterized protein n=1 Tax=Hortaea werneckii TaxID=91943 RepID=A0A3M7B0E7_HORWE|nr:hypothetical protein D0866_06054 [Hortaea werneckii]